MKCLVCNRNFDKNDCLGHHIKSGHDMTTQQYYDKYIAATSSICKTSFIIKLHIISKKVK